MGWQGVRANIRDVAFLAGRLLVASPRLVDPNFARAVVALLNHDEKGAMGLVINRPTEIPVAEHLPDWVVDRLVPPAVVFYGGPVEQAVAIGLRESYHDASEEVFASGVSMIDLSDEEGGESSSGGLRVFAGYAGWGPGQLEDEVEEESWIILPARAGDVFSSSPADLWGEVLARQGGQIALLASMPLDPELN